MKTQLYVLTPNEFQKKFESHHIQSSPNASLFVINGQNYFMLKKPDGYDLYEDAFLIATSTGEDESFELY